MSSRSLLIFDLDGARFGVDATLVRETVWLPELTPIEEAPSYIAGMFSLRGQIVPVTDLLLRFGHPALPYTTDDQVVVLELDQLLMGVIVNEVHEVIELPAEAIRPPPRYDLETPAHGGLVAGEAREGDEIVTLLDASLLMHSPHPHLPLLAGEGEEQPHPGSPPPAEEDWRGGLHFCPKATPEERAIFHERARALMELAIEEEDTSLGLAVVEVGGEYFGVELAVVQEFCDIAQLTPIPCCPPHILGAISLRGNLFTLLDVRAALNLPLQGKPGGKVVVALHGEQLVGLAVDAVHDVVYLRQEELQASPALLRERHGVEIRGAAAYGSRMMAVLDLPALLARKEWIVNEQY